MEAANLNDSSTFSAENIETVVSKIFEQCDATEQGLISVSKLITFLEVFLQNESVALLDLQHMLNGNHMDALVDRDTVKGALMQWLPMFLKDTFVCNKSLQELINPLSTSTPNKRKHVRRDINDADLSISPVQADATDVVEPQDVFHQKMTELLYQYHQKTEQLDYALCGNEQLEELNNKLQLRNGQLQQELTTERQKVEQFIKELRDYNVLAESLNRAQEKNGCLEKRLKDSDTEYNRILGRLDQLEYEKDNLELIVKKSNEQHREVVKALSEADATLKANELMFASLRKELTDTQEERDLANEKLTFVMDVNEKLQIEKDIYLAQLRTVANVRHKSFSIIQDSSRPTKHPHKARLSLNYNSPIRLAMQQQQACPRRHSISHVPLISREFNDFNSPTLLTALENPLSPIADDSPSNDFDIENSFSLMSNLSSLSNRYELSFNEDDINVILQSTRASEPNGGQMTLAKELAEAGFNNIQVDSDVQRTPLHSMTILNDARLSLVEEQKKDNGKDNILLVQKCEQLEGELREAREDFAAKLNAPCAICVSRKSPNVWRCFFNMFKLVVVVALSLMLLLMLANLYLIATHCVKCGWKISRWSRLFCVNCVFDALEFSRRRVQNVF